jgi:hypothetical protein
MHIAVFEEVLYGEIYTSSEWFPAVDPELFVPLDNLGMLRLTKPV